MPTFTLRTALPVSADELYRWHLRPGAFERLVPPWQDVRVESRSGPVAEGMRAVLRLRMGPLWLRWEALHTHFDPGREFRDTQVRGPFAHWVHTHRMIPAGDADSVLEDEICYDAGIAESVRGSSIRRELERAFAFRHQRTRDDLARHQQFRDHPRWRILIGGASGMVGRAISAFLASGGHQVDRLVRRRDSASSRNELGGDDVPWGPAAGLLAPTAIDGVDAVVHLSGENIAGGRWTPAFKQAILRSRIDSTALLCRTLAGLARKPRVLICASAVGYYGDHGAEQVDESAAAGRGFLPEVCRAWEAACEPARQAGIRVVNVRIGLVISGGGGALRKMLPPFRLGLGGPIGSGRQYMSWIGLDDLVYAIQHLLFATEVFGPVNATAPQPVTNAEFTRALGRVLRHPTPLPVPAFAVRALFGQMGEECLLQGVRAQPTRLSESGFVFTRGDLESALRFELGRQPTS